MKTNRLFVFGILFLSLFVLALGLIVLFGGKIQKYRESVEPRKQQDRTLAVGALDYVEGIIWAYMIAELVRAHTDIEVKLIDKMGLVSVAEAAIKSGYIDVYPEYLGSLYTVMLRKTKTVEAEQALRIVQREMAEKFQIRVLDPYGFNNNYAIGMLRPRAEELGIEKISDLAKYPDLIAGFDSDFLMREVGGATSMFAAYGFEPTNPMVELGYVEKYFALDEGRVDYTDPFTTDAKLKNFDIKLLEDDGKFFPQYTGYALSVVREDSLKRLPELGPILRSLEGIASDEEAVRLNFEVEENNRDYQEVVLEFLASKDFVGDKPQESP